MPHSAYAPLRSKVSNISAETLMTPLIGRSPAMKQLLNIIDRIAPTDSNVLITGTTGTGKELVARSVHERSQRRQAPFIDINCSAIPETLFESELFGHQRGTFTGAHETRHGLFEEASGGSVFLDEVDTLDLSSQAKLLRVLQERQIRRVGGRENIPVNVRIIAATNCDLRSAVAKGTFRPDLFFRLRVVPLHVPDLRERGSDIELLVRHFLNAFSLRHNEPPKRISAEAMRVLLKYSWPGNVRELENVLEYALTISRDEEIELDSLPPDLLMHSIEDSDALKDCIKQRMSLAEVERRYILTILEHYGGHQIKTAHTLGIDRRTLYRKLQQFGVFFEK